MAKKIIKKNIGVKKGPNKNSDSIPESPDNIPLKNKSQEVKELLEEMGNKIPVVDRIGPAKGKKFSEIKYIRICEDEGIEKFKEMSDRIQNKSIQWAFYAIDNDKGYHYYLILK